MLDIRRIRQNPGELEDMLSKRGSSVDTSPLLRLDEERRGLLAKAEALKNRRNEASREIAQIKRGGGDASALVAEMKGVGDSIAVLDARVKEIDVDLESLLLLLPNYPHESVPVGTDDSANLEIRRWGEVREFSFAPRAHWEIGPALGIMDFEAGARVSGARFTFLKGLGARLERSLIALFLDTHVADGFEEVYPPYLVTRASMTGTGQLPKFEEDAYKVSEELFLIPTAEVPVTNMYRESILEGERLPLRNVAYSVCFRSEAGSAGRDTRGYIRQHQFNKVEMVKVCTPGQSYPELEHMTAQAEKVLRLLNLPHRVVCLCTGDLGFSAAKTYDVEVWMPSYGRYVEISSCSNCEDFQARRAGVRYRESAKDKPAFCHTLNGSGVAVGRALAAILENCQNEDGSVALPPALHRYMGQSEIR